MKTLSVNDFKKGKHHIKGDGLPQPDTYTRALYEICIANKGRVIEMTIPKKFTSIFTTLVDFYGLDIRSMGKRRMLIAGEWEGSKYHDFVADRIEAEAIKNERRQRRYRK